MWGKTGTTEDYGDAWFAGFTRKLTAVVWMGYPEGQSKPLFNVHGVAKVNGGSLPARIFERFMSKAGAGDDEGPSEAPRFEGRPLSPVVRYTVPSTSSSSSDGRLRLLAPDHDGVGLGLGSVPTRSPPSARRRRRRRAEQSDNSDGDSTQSESTTPKTTTQKPSTPRRTPTTFDISHLRARSRNGRR